MKQLRHPAVSFWVFSRIKNYTKFDETGGFLYIYEFLCNKFIINYWRDGAVCGVKPK